MTDDTNNDNSIIQFKNSNIVKVGNSISISNKILYGSISSLFNTAYCKLNSRKNLNVDTDYLCLMESSSDYRRKCNNSLYLAKTDDDYREALMIFGEILKIKPKHILSIEMSALCNLCLRNFYEAIEDYSKAIEIDPKNAIAFNNRGFAKYLSNDDKGAGAIEDYNKAIEIDPKYAVPYYEKGYLKYISNDYQGAIEDYNKAIEIDPNYSSAYTMRGNAKNYLNNYQGAIEDCTKAIYISPKHEIAYAERGHAKGKLNDYQGAIEDYSKVIEINPDFAIGMGIDEDRKKILEILKALNDI